MHIEHVITFALMFAMASLGYRFYMSLCDNANNMKPLQYILNLLLVFTFYLMAGYLLRMGITGILK